MKKDVMIVTGAGQISMAIARRVGFGKKIILAMIKKAQEYGEIKYLVNGAGVSPSQAPIKAILKEDLELPMKWRISQNF